MATSLGLGTSFSGSIYLTSESYAPLVELLKLPEGYSPHGTFVTSCMVEFYHWIPLRNPIDINLR